jgi:hypothetical protein
MPDYTASKGRKLEDIKLQTNKKSQFNLKIFFLDSRK